MTDAELAERRAETAARRPPGCRCSACTAPPEVFGVDAWRMALALLGGGGSSFPTRGQPVRRFEGTVQEWASGKRRPGAP